MPSNRGEFLVVFLLQEVRPVGRHLADRAGGHEAIRLPGHVIPGTGPRILDGTPDHVGPDGIPFHIADHGEEMPIRLDREGVKPFLEQVPPHAGAEVHVPGIASMGFPDRARERVHAHRDDDQVDMVGHQTPRPKLETAACAKLPEESQVLVAVLLGGEDGQGPDPPLDDMVR